MSKYRNKKTMLDGHTFDSLLEAERYKQLKILHMVGDIGEIKLQPRFELIPSFTDSQGEKHRKTEYVADFAYHEKGQLIVEDVKGRETEAFKLKKKLFLLQYKDVTFRILTRQDIL